MKYPILFLLLCSRILCGTITNTFIHPYALAGWESASSTVNWSDASTIPRFSVPGQHLDSVTVTFHTSGSFIYYGENTLSVPTLETLTVATVGSFSVPGATGLAPWGGTQSVTAPAFDGVVDQHGASGFMLFVQSQDDRTVSLPTAPFAGAGSVPCALASVGTAVETGGTGDAGSVFGYAELYLSATVIYTYSPKHGGGRDGDEDDDRDDRREHGGRR